MFNFGTKNKTSDDQQQVPSQNQGISIPPAQSVAVSQQGQQQSPQPVAQQIEPMAATPQPIIQEVQSDQLSAVQPQPTQVQPQSPAASGFADTSYASVIDALVQNGHITSEQANQVMVENISSGEAVEAILEKKQIVSEEILTRAKAAYHQIPYVKIADTGSDPEALSRIPESVAKLYNLLPLSYNADKGTIAVAMVNPLDLSAIDFAERKSGTKIEAYFAMPSELDRALAEHYSQSLSREVTAALEQTAQVAEAQQKKRLQQMQQMQGETIREAPITKIVETVVSFAMKARASDIHIEPQEIRTRVRYRVDGILSEKLILPSSVHEAVVSRIKILSNLKIDEKRIPQDGRFNFTTQEAEVDLRVSTLPTIHGEKIVMRLLKKDQKVPDLSELGLTGLALHQLEKAIKVPHGIILVTGPTGSGKTTTLYSVLDRINSPRVNIMTLEDPVEYQMTGINQVQVNVPAGLTFSSGLRSFLRQDPNIIMVGEIRDKETTELAIQASLTGHLVFSTLHTSSAAGAVPRLMDMGGEPFLLASSMTLVMAQRVVRVINPEYKEAYTPEPAVIDDIQKVLGKHFDTWCEQKNIKPEELQLYRTKKDRPQTEPEYKGRIGIFEVMNIDDQMGGMILERKTAQDLEDIAQKNGMLLMKQDGYMKAIEGLTTIEEVLRVAQI